MLTCYSIPEHASQIRADLVSAILEVQVQKFFIDLQTSKVSRVDKRYDCHHHEVSLAPSLCQSTLVALLVSALAPLKDLAPQVWLREGKVERSESWNTSVQEIVVIFESIQSTPFTSKRHNCKVAARLQSMVNRITAAVETLKLPEATLRYMEKQRAKLGNLAFPAP